MDYIYHFKTSESENCNYQSLISFTKLFQYESIGKFARKEHKVLRRSQLNMNLRKP